MAREHKIADKLSYQELHKIQGYLIEMSDTSLTLGDVWADIGKILTTDLTKKQFIDSLAVNIKLHRLGGYKVKEDKLVLEDLDAAKSSLKNLENPPEKPAALEPEEKEYKWNTSNKPITTLTRTKKLWINDSCYSVPMAPVMLVYFLERIMLAKRDPKGVVLFEGQRYDCDHQLLHRYLSLFLGITPDVETPDERTHDENGVPLWMTEKEK